MCHDAAKVEIIKLRRIANRTRDTYNINRKNTVILSPSVAKFHRIHWHCSVYVQCSRSVNVLNMCVQIRYWRQHEREAAADRVRTAGLETSARVSGLRPSTRYHVAVLAYNSAGTGPPSPRTTVTTRKPRTAFALTHVLKEDENTQ